MDSLPRTEKFDMDRVEWARAKAELMRNAIRDWARLSDPERREQDNERPEFLLQLLATSALSISSSV